MTKMSKHVHPALAHNNKLREKFIKRLTPPNRSDFDRDSRYQAAVQKQIRYLGAITKVLVMLVKEHSWAMAKKEACEEKGFEYLHTIPLTKLYCIAAGGGKYVPKKKDDFSEVYLIPITSTYNEEVKMLVEGFFTQTFRGTNLTGSSKWAPRQVPRFNVAVVELLKAIKENFPRSFIIISEFLFADKEELCEREIIFETTEDVPEEELLKLRDALLNY